MVFYTITKDEVCYYSISFEKHVTCPRCITDEIFNQIVAKFHNHGIGFGDSAVMFVDIPNNNYNNTIEIYLNDYSNCLISYMAFNIEDDTILDIAPVRSMNFSHLQNIYLIIPDIKRDIRILFDKKYWFELDDNEDIMLKLSIMSRM